MCCSWVSPQGLQTNSGMGGIVLSSCCPTYSVLLVPHRALRTTCTASVAQAAPAPRAWLSRCLPRLTRAWLETWHGYGCARPGHAVLLTLQ
jgi:hypothetical protein